MKAIPSHPLLKQRTVSHADTPQHGHGSLPRTEAAPTERTRHASGYGCSRAAQWLLYHRLPDPQLSPVAITPTTGWRIRTLCRKARWPPRSTTNASRPCDEAFAGGDWLSPPATDPCLLPVTSASKTRARCRQRGVCRAAQPPRRKFWPEEVWRPSFVTRGAKLRVWRQRLTPLTRPRRSDWEGSGEPHNFRRSVDLVHGLQLPGPALSFISPDPHGSVGPLSHRSTPWFDFRRVFRPREKKCGFGRWNAEIGTALCSAPFGTLVSCPARPSVSREFSSLDSVTWVLLIRLSPP